MKRIAVTIFVLMCAALAYAQTTLTFAFEDKEDFPSIMGNGTELAANNPGASVEILRIIEKRLGITIKIVRLPWKRALESDLASGAIDGLLTASYKAEREAWGAFPMVAGKPDPSKSLYSQSYYFYRLKGSAVSWNGTALVNLGKPIGIPMGYSVVDEMKKLGYAVEETDSTLTCLKMLQMGRLGAVLTLELSTDVLLERNTELNKAIEKIPTAYTTKPYYIMLSKQFVQRNPELAKAIWDLVGQLQDEYTKAAAKYFQ